MATAQTRTPRHSGRSRPGGGSFDPAAETKYSEDQARDEAGRWTVGGGSFHPAAPDGSVASTEGYVYHATNAENAADIAREGLRTHGPTYGTPDQDAWPDGSTERRSYFVAEAATAWPFAPEHGAPVILRVQRERAKVRRESTGDLYVRRTVAPDALEILRDDGEWVPLTEAYPPNDSKALKYSDDQPRDEAGRWTSGGGGGSGGTTEPNAESRRARGEHVGRTDGTPNGDKRPAMATLLADPNEWKDHAARQIQFEHTGLPGTPAAFTEAARDQPYETGAFYDDNGNGLLEITNYNEEQVSSTSFSDIDGAALYIHNHPNGAPLSSSDITMAVRHDLAEVRAVGRLDDGMPVDYSMKMPPAGRLIEECVRAGIQYNPIAWGDKDDPPSVREKAARMAGELFDEYFSAAHAQFYSRMEVLVKQMPAERAQNIATQEAGLALNKRFARAIGASFTVTRKGVA